MMPQYHSPGSGLSSSDIEPALEDYYCPILIELDGAGGGALPLCLAGRKYFLQHLENLFLHDIGRNIGCRIIAALTG
jgi:hypothetical protein